MIKDLCGRLPYGAKAKYYGAAEECECCDIIEGIYPMDNEVVIGQYALSVDNIKPYLFPLSSMTEEIMDEIYATTGVYDISIDSSVHIEAGTTFEDLTKIFDILHKHHIDYRGFIPMGLALDATGLNIY